MSTVYRGKNGKNKKKKKKKKGKEHEQKQPNTHEDDSTMTLVNFWLQISQTKSPLALAV